MVPLNVILIVIGLKKAILLSKLQNVAVLTTKKKKVGSSVLLKIVYNVCYRLYHYAF